MQQWLVEWSVATAWASGPIDTAPRLATVLTNILNFLLSVVGVVGIIGLVIAGALYFFSAGDMRRAQSAKKAALASVVGIVLALGGYVLILTITQFFGP
jgi:hypothetical protein